MTREKRRPRNSKFVWQDAFARSGLQGNAGFIGLLMSLKDNGDGRGFFLSQKEISEMTGLNERTVRDHIRTLKSAGWVRVKQRGGNQGGNARANTYELTYPESQPAAPRSQEGASRSQEEREARLVDPRLLDPVYLHPPTGQDLRPAEEHWRGQLKLEEGEEVTEVFLARQDPALKKCFAPSFDNEGMWVYVPSLSATSTTSPLRTTDTRIDDEPARQERRVDTRTDQQQRRSHEYMLREEGLNNRGEPRRSERSGSRSRR